MNKNKSIDPLKKPVLRGYFHQEAFFISIGAGALLIARCNSFLEYISSIVYTFGVLFLFGMSAFYHRITWSKKVRAILKKIDHSAIFVLIASSFTPICLLAFPDSGGKSLLIIIWILATVGIVQSIFFVNTPKYITAAFYIVMGWTVLPYLINLKDSLGLTQLWLIISGGIVYTVGAVFYAIKKPNFVSGVFGYHELFHVFTIVGAVLHFIVIYQLID